MKDFVNRLVEIERALSEEKGRFNLFALFLREDAPTWDLLIAAPWADKGKPSTLKSIAQKLQKSLNKSELLMLSRIVIVDQGHPALAAIQKAIRIEHGRAEIINSTFFGLQIKFAYVITSRRSDDDTANDVQQPAAPAPSVAGG